MDAIAKDLFLSKDRAEEAAGYFEKEIWNNAGEAGNTKGEKIIKRNQTTTRD